MSDANVRRLVSSLTRMRGAALKLGQFMSIQGDSGSGFADRQITICYRQRSSGFSSRYKRTPTICQIGRWR